MTLLGTFHDELLVTLALGHFEVVTTGGCCSALAAPDPGSATGWSPVLLTDGDHGVAFSDTQRLVLLLEYNDDSPWWEFDLTQYPIAAVVALVRAVLACPGQASHLIDTHRIRPIAHGSDSSTAPCARFIPGGHGPVVTALVGAG